MKQTPRVSILLPMMFLAMLSTGKADNGAVTMLQMRDWCASVIDGSQNNSETPLQQGYCIGSFVTLRNMGVLKSIPRACIPDATTTDDFIRIYIHEVGTLKTDIEAVRSNWFAAAVLILQYKFPCQ